MEFNQVNNGRFVGNIPFGSFYEKAIICSTFNNNIYLHIKDRSRNKTVTLKYSDFLQILRLKDKIVFMSERASNILAKQQKDVNNNTDFSNDPYIIGSDAEDELGSVNNSQPRKMLKRSNMQNVASDSEIVEEVPKRRRVVASYTDVNSSDEENVIVEKPKAKPRKKSVKAKGKVNDSGSGGFFYLEEEKVPKQSKKKAGLIRNISTTTTSSSQD